MSDQDSRMRELTYRLTAMAPDAPPFPEESVMKAPNNKQRSPVMIWAAAGLAVVLLVGVPLLFFRGGDEGPDEAAPTSAPTVTATSVPVTGPTVAPEEEQEVVFSIYLFSEEMRTPIGDPALVPIRQRATIVVVGAPVADEHRVFAAIEMLVAPNDRPGFGTSIPGGTELLDVVIDSGVATVDLSSEFESGGGSHAMFTRLAQVVFTATQFPEVDSVLFSIDGEVVDVFSGEGILLEGPQTREDYYGILPQIFLDTPAIGESVESPVTISGVANVFEAVVSYEIVAGGEVLVDGSAIASCGTGCWGDYQVTVDFNVPEQTGGEVVVYEVSAQDGSRINELRYPVTLLPGGDAGVTTTTTTTTTAGPTTTTLPGEAFEIGPAAGDVIAVVGVAHDDVLNMRSGPGTNYDVVLRLDPLADDLVATGRHRLLTSSIWDEITVGGVTGWVNSSYVGYLGYTEDLTGVVEDRVGVAIETETMQEMGQIVAEAMASADEGGSRIVMSVAPSVDDLGEITMDVWGLADDAQLGWRLHVLGTPSESGEGFVLESVEATAFCGRGVTEEGWCV